jgi:hypothetical protein
VFGTYLEAEADLVQRLILSNTRRLEVKQQFPAGVLARRGAKPSGETSSTLLYIGVLVDARATVAIEVTAFVPTA